MKRCSLACKLLEAKFYYPFYFSQSSFPPKLNVTLSSLVSVSPGYVHQYASPCCESPSNEPYLLSRILFG